MKCTEGEEVGLFIIGQRQLLFPFLRGKESRDCLKTTFSFVGYKSILLKAGIFIFNISLVLRRVLRIRELEFFLEFCFLAGIFFLA